MKLLLLLFAVTTLLSCEQQPKQTQNTSAPSNLKSTSQKYVYTRYVYLDTKGDSIIFENSLPKGGQTFKSKDGKELIYTVFWTRVINKSNQDLQLNLDFKDRFYQLESDPGRSFKLLLPSDTLTSEKEKEFDYGLDVAAFLSKHFDNKAFTQKTVAAQSMDAMYIVCLFDKWEEGTIRTAMSIEEQKLFYTLNKMKIACGSINLEDLYLVQ